MRYISPAFIRGGFALLPLLLLCAPTWAQAQSSSSQASSSAPAGSTAAEIQAAEQAANQLGLSVQNAPALDSNGNVETNSDGTIKTVPESSAEAQGQTAFMQNMMGVSNYQGLASPAASGAAGASATLIGYVDFSCALAPGVEGTAGEVDFEFEGCNSQDGSISSINLRVCTDLQNGGTCPDTDFSASTHYPSGAYSTLGKTQIGVGCNNQTQTCRVTVSSQYSLQGSGTSITQQAEQDQGGQTLRADVTATASSGAYQQESSDTRVTKCYAQNENSVQQNGSVSSCDGTSSATVDTSSMSNMAASTPTQTTNSQSSLVQVETDSGVVESIANSQGTSSPSAPLIFNGQDLRCTMPVGVVDKTASPDCCELGLTSTTSGGGVAGSCSQDEVNLAAQRRAKQTVYIGAYCSKSRSYGLFSTCIQQTETYCAFGGLLPQLIQVQGRQQLSQDAASVLGATLKTQQMTFSYYSGSGGWVSPVTLNGQEVTAFEEPSYCSDSQQAAAALQANPNAIPCPTTLSLWFAVCEQPGSCGALPTLPSGESGNWQLEEVDPLSSSEVAISRYVLEKGACDTSSGQCYYELSAWPAGVGGEALVTEDMTVDLSVSSASTAVPAVTLGNYLIEAKGTRAFTPGALPASLQGEVSSTAGASFTSFSLPTQITSAVSIPGTNITATGGCEASTGQCKYQFTGNITVTAKPWGNAKSPDCSGFNMAQMSVLDFSAMDLSAYTDQLTDGEGPSASQLISQAEQQAAQGNQYTSSSPSGGEVAFITPKEDLGPFSATLSISPNWPQAYSDPSQNTDPIFGVTIDWGDCSGTTSASQNPGGGFTATHVYKSPAAIGMCDSSGPAGPSNPRDLNNQIVLTINAKDGTHTASLSVRDVYQNYTSPAGSGSSGTATSSQSVSSPPPGQ